MTNKLGIIAGEGKMPLYIAAKAAQKGYEVFIAGVKGNAREDDFRQIPCVFKTLRLGQMGACMEFFKAHGVQQILMAGRVQHTSIFANLLPDLRGAKFLASLKNMGTKYLLSRVIEEFHKEGLEFTHSALFLEDFMPKQGVLSTRQPTEDELKTVQFGLKIAKAVAALDIGLTCVVSQNATIAVEGMEGTDQCILRAGELYKKSAEKDVPVAVVKVARPDQDARFDLPVVGKGTLESAHKAGFHIVAFEAGKTLVLDLEDVIKLANKYKICFLAV